MKDSTGLETSTKIFFSVTFNLVYIRILKGLAILFLEFDDVMVKALYSQWLVFIR